MHENISLLPKYHGSIFDFTENDAMRSLEKGAAVPKFTIKIDLDQNKFPLRLIREIPYFKNSRGEFRDRAEFIESSIIITGKRSKTPSQPAFQNDTSSYHSAVLKVLLYAYYCFGPFSVDSVRLTWDQKNKLPETLNITHQPFEAAQPYSDSYEMEILFDSLLMSKEALRALMYLTVSNNDDNYTFENLWRCFNSLLRTKYSGNDKQLLKAERTDLELHFDCYPLLQEFASQASTEDISERHIASYLLHEFPKGKNNASKILTTFTDSRVCIALLDKLSCRQKDFADEGIFEKIQESLSSHTNERNDSDVARFLILQYAYMLRCKLFHGENRPLHFLATTSDEAELDYICEPLRRICYDILLNRLP